MTIKERLEVLERELCRLAMPNVTGEVRASRFVLLNENHEVCAALTAQTDGPVLSLKDKNGTVRAKLSVDADGHPVLFLGDENGTPRTGLAVAKGGLSSLLLCDANRKPRVVLTVSADGRSALSLLDASSKPRVNLSTNKDDQPDLTLYDENGDILWCASDQFLSPDNATRKTRRSRARRGRSSD